MSTRRNPLRAIRDAILGRTPPPRREFGIEELLFARERPQTEASERLEPSPEMMAKARLLYRLDPLIFSGVNKLVRRITQTRIYFDGPNEDENRQAEELFEKSNLKRLLPHLVRDIFIYGFGAAEKIERGDYIELRQINPEELDYQREGGKLVLDKDGLPVGYVWRPMSGEEVKLPREKVLLLKFFTLGEHCLGISPVETAYKAAWIKLNLEEAIGEAIFRHGFPLFKFKIGTPEPGPFHEITPEKIEAAKKFLPKLESTTELLLPWWMDVEAVTGRVDLRGISEFLSLLIMEIQKAFELPTGTARGAAEAVEFEKAVVSYQEELKRQLEEQFFRPFYQARGFTTSPSLTFVEYSPELEQIKLRRLSAWAKHGLITRTDELENALRKREGFPLKSKKKEGPFDSCIFNLGSCPIREEEAIPLDRLAAFCNICIKRLSRMKELGDKDASG